MSQKHSLQDTLRLVTLWFQYGGHPEIVSTFTEGVTQLDTNTWLQVGGGGGAEGAVRAEVLRVPAFPWRAQG